MTDWGIVTARLLQFGPALILCGTPLFFLYGIDPGDLPAFKRGARGLKSALMIAGMLSFCGAVWWVMAETASIFSDPGAFSLNAIWTVLTGTGFGRAMFLRIILIAVTIILPFVARSGRRMWALQALIGGAIVASFAWTGHGVKDEGFAGYVHLGGDIVHLLAAAAWVGALLALAFILVESIRQRTGARAALRGLEAFSSIGVMVIALLLLSGFLNSWFLVGLAHIGQLVTSPYGLLLDVKFALFAAMLALALANRYRFSPRLSLALAQGTSHEPPLRLLKRSVLMEAGFALLVLAVVSLMGTLDPPG